MFTILSKNTEGIRTTIMKRVVVYSVVLLTILSTHCYSFETKQKVGFSIGTPSISPYFGIKYGLSSKLGIEARYSNDSGIIIYSGRVCYNFNPEKRAVIYSGIEYDALSFDTAETYGTGQSVELFAGIEIFITPWIAVGLDIGPVYTQLVSGKNYSYQISSTDILGNIGITLYF